MPELLMIVAAYLVGSLSSAILICRLMGLSDPRCEGSGNPGATNVLRIGGKLPAVLTLVGDFVKGVLPVLASHWVGFGSLVVGLVMLAAVLGHLYPVFFRLQGGKGVATGLGVLIGMSPLVGGLTVATWLVMAGVFRISSLAALTAALLSPIYAWGFGLPVELVVAALLVALLQFWRHRHNLGRLLRGEEPRIGKS
ncbi:MAG: glycerol-3-phosphate 1-O-acyltransferase PlsY [Gammaproteobacteria bacterium]|nr:glycerol-3-phosphate 1-O-acyltransferase PlsY [Gammaproteobacteria bacterium]